MATAAGEFDPVSGIAVLDPRVALAIAANIRSVRAATHHREMRVMFRGDGGDRPRIAAAVIDGTRLSHVTDLSFP